MLPGHLKELGIVPYASYVESLRVVTQEEVQDTVPVVDLVGRYAIADLVVVVVAAAAAAAGTATDVNNYKMAVWQPVLYSFQMVLWMGELML